MTYQRILTVILLTAFSGGLFYCNTEVKEVSTEQPAKNTTSTPLDSSFTAFLQRKKAEGFDFFATGQEPGWSLEIDSTNLIRFTSDAMPVVNSPWIAPTTKENTTTYTTSTESATMEISIVQGACADMMSGQLYTHAVTVIIKRGTDKDFKTFKGCGTFVN
jgi:heat shock protein HslJ